VTWSVTRANEASTSSPSVTECLQAQLQVATEQGGGGGSTNIPLGYTFLIVNIGTKSCVLQGYPYEVIFSTASGVPVKVSISHQSNVLYSNQRHSALCCVQVELHPSASVIQRQCLTAKQAGDVYRNVDRLPPARAIVCLVFVRVRPQAD